MLIIEDGSQIANADSYISAVDADAVAQSYGLVLDSANAETNLKAAYKWLNTLESQLQGSRLSDIDTQTSQTGVYPRTPVYLRGNLLGENDIPVELIEAQVLAAYANESSSILLPTTQGTTGGIKRERFDGVGELEYYDGANLDTNQANSALQLALSTLSDLMQTAITQGGAGFAINKHYS